MRILLLTKRLPGTLLLMMLCACTSGNDVTITFNTYVNGEALEYGKKYVAPNGNGTFSIYDFKLYVSNVQLINSETAEAHYIEKDSYHLLKFDSSNSFSFSLNAISPGSYDKIKISIGIDEAANLSIASPGDLDPLNQMAWNWTSGYKFLLLEGLYVPENAENDIPIVYHIGFSENKKDLVFDLTSKNDIRFAIEITELFKNPNAVDFNAFPKVLFNKEHAALIASNYSNSFMTLE